MNERNDTFKRIEQKYLLTLNQYNCLLTALGQRLEPDQYGWYEIANIYYDTDGYDLIRTSLEKPVYKEKLRLRSYGRADGTRPVYVEIKKKLRGIVYKRRTALPLDQALALLAQPDAASASQLRGEIKTLYSRYPLKPKVYLSYRRFAMLDPACPSFRLTFDRAIRFRLTDLSLASSSSGQLLLPDDRILMEVKIARALPLWFCHILAELAIYPRAFSKYGICYQNCISASRALRPVTAVNKSYLSDADSKEINYA